MGHCCKCGRETAHAYAYYSGDLLNAKRPKTYTNVEARAAFLCTRCAMGGYAFWHLFGWVAFSVETAIDAGSVVSTVIIGITAAFFLAALIHALVVMRQDKPLPFYVREFQAKKRIVKTMRKQNPGTNYFAPSDYH